MTKYWKAEIVKKELDGIGNVHPGIISAIKNILDDIPAENVKEVKHGEWIKDKTQIRDDGEIYDYCCSICGHSAYPGPYNNNDNLTYFCPWCGNPMDGAKLHEESEEENGSNK